MPGRSPQNAEPKRIEAKPAELRVRIEALEKWAHDLRSLNLNARLEAVEHPKIIVPDALTETPERFKRKWYHLRLKHF